MKPLLVMPGLGSTVDLGVFNRVAGIDGHPARVEVYDGRGAFWHTVLGVGAGLLPSVWPVASAVVFSAYELSKIEGEKPFAQIAGALLEFGIGMGLAALYLGVKR